MVFSGISIVNRWAGLSLQARRAGMVIGDRGIPSHEPRRGGMDQKPSTPMPVLRTSGHGDFVFFYKHAVPTALKVILKECG
jgi:hypothetical protein